MGFDKFEHKIVSPSEVSEREWKCLSSLRTYPKIKSNRRLRWWTSTCLRMTSDVMFSVTELKSVTKVKTVWYKKYTYIQRMDWA